MDEKIMDMRGLKCPLPVLRVRKELETLQPGDRIIALCTDPMAAIDIPNLLRQTGDALEGQERTDGLLTFRILKA